MQIRQIIFFLVGLFPLISYSQRGCECGRSYLGGNGPQWMHYFEIDTLKKNNISRITVHAGPLIKKDSIESYKSFYRIYRFLVQEGKLVESVGFARKDIYDGRTVGIPKEYQKFIYSGDTLITMYSTWAQMSYEERYSNFLYDFNIDDYLEEVSLKYASVSDIYLNDSGNVIYFKQRGEKAEILPEKETTYYYYHYDDRGKLVSVEGEHNLNPFGIDSVKVYKMRYEYDSEKSINYKYEWNDGREHLVFSYEVDSADRVLSTQEYDENGGLSNHQSLEYDSHGRLIRAETRFTKKLERDDVYYGIGREILEFEYHPDGLLHYINVKTNKGSCGLMFSYK